MTFKKILVRLLTFAFLVSSIQISSFAASDGRVDKVLTVGEAEVLQGNEAPKLLIHLKDALKAGDIFYLELEGAKWQEKVTAKVAGNEDVVLEVTSMSENELQIAVKEGEVAADQTIEIELAVQLTASEASVKIDGNNTSVEDQTFTFAKAMPYVGDVTVSGVETVTSNGIMGKLVINEPFSGAFAKAVAKGKSPVVTICLDTNDYAFDLTDEKWQLKGTKGFEGLKGEKIRKIDAQTLEVTLPDTKDYKNKGSFELTGVNLVAQGKENMPKEVGVIVSGDLIKEVNLRVLKVSDYDITLKSELQKVYSGSEQKVRFGLEEVVANSLVRQRPTTFTLTNGAYLVADEEGKVKVVLNGKETTCSAVMAGEKAIGFEVETLPEDKVNTFEVDAYIPADTQGEVKVLATGRSLIEDLSVPVLEAQTPFNINVTPFEVQVGVKDQVGGVIEIIETSAGRMMQDENIVIDLEGSNIDVTELPAIEVTAGDLRVGKAKIADHRLVIPVTRKSHTASTLKISNFKVTAGQNTAYGNYEVMIGGGALSHLGEGEMKAPVKQTAFIEAVENKKDRADEGQSDKSASTDEVKEADKKANEQVISFKVDEKAYTVDGETHALSVAPYEKDGQLMVQTEGVLAALGLSEDEFEWESSTRTVIFKSQPEVSFTIGEDTMHIGDKAIPLETAAELTHGKTYIPMNALCEALGISYHYEKASLTIYRV